MKKLAQRAMHCRCGRTQVVTHGLCGFATRSKTVSPRFTGAISAMRPAPRSGKSRRAVTVAMPALRVPRMAKFASRCGAANHNARPCPGCHGSDELVLMSDREAFRCPERPEIASGALSGFFFLGTRLDRQSCGGSSGLSRLLLLREKNKDDDKSTDAKHDKRDERTSCFFGNPESWILAITCVHHG